MEGNNTQNCQPGPQNGYIPPTRNASAACQDYSQQQQREQEEILKGANNSSQNQGGPDPYLCERCNKRVNPIPDTNPTCKTHIIAVVLFLIGLPFLVFIPYCFDWFGKPVNRCPSCGLYMSPPPST